MALVIPPGVDAEGSVLVKFVPTLADPSAPTTTELNAVGAVDMSCSLTQDGFKPGADTATGTDTRLCSKQVYETKGATTWSIDNLTYIWDPQNPDSDSNKVYAALPEDTAGFLVVRWGKDVEDFPALAAADIVDVFPVVMGPQVPQPPEANSKLKVQQKPFVTGSAVRDVTLAA